MENFIQGAQNEMRETALCRFYNKCSLTKNRGCMIPVSLAKVILLERRRQRGKDPSLRWPEVGSRLVPRVGGEK